MHNDKINSRHDAVEYKHDESYRNIKYPLNHNEHLCRVKWKRMSFVVYTWNGCKKMKYTGKKPAR